MGSIDPLDYNYVVHFDNLKGNSTEWRVGLTANQQIKESAEACPSHTDNHDA
jgi:hypothetical protein